MSSKLPITNANKYFIVFFILLNFKCEKYKFNKFCNYKIAELILADLFF